MVKLKKAKARKKGIKRKAVKRKSVKRITAKKRRIKKPLVKKTPAIKNIVGIVTHYFPKVRAAVVKLKGPLSLGETVKIKGHTTDFTQNVTSMQIEHVPITAAKKGDEIGLLVDSRVRVNDIVYRP